MSSQEAQINECKTIPALRIAVFLACSGWICGILAQTPQADSFNPQLSGKVNSLALQADGKLVLAGDLFVRLNPKGVPDKNFAVIGSTYVDYYGTPVPPETMSLAIQPDGKIIVGGFFNLIGGISCRGLTRLKADGTVDTDFNPKLEVSGWAYEWAYPFNYPLVDALLLQPDGKLLVGGWFSSIDGQAHTNLARLNPDGSVDNDFQADTDGQVMALAEQADGRMVVGGFFGTVGGYARMNLARIKADGSVDQEFTAGANSEVRALIIEPKGGILVGGLFDSLGGQSSVRLGKLNTDGTVAPDFVSPMEGFAYGTSVNALVLQADGKTLIGGSFDMVNGQSHKGICRLNSDGTVDSDFDPELTGGYWDLYTGADPLYYPLTINSLALQGDGRILLGGSQLTGAGGQPRTNLARLNNTDPTTNHLAYQSSNIVWLRGGSIPEIWRTTFESSGPGASWDLLGAGHRVPGGWELSNVSLPNGARVRARGFIATGGQSQGMLESYMVVAPQIDTSGGGLGLGAKGFAFNLTGGAGEVVLEASTDLHHWLPLLTNSLPDGPLFFNDPNTGRTRHKFYRLRAWSGPTPIGSVGPGNSGYRLAVPR